VTIKRDINKLIPPKARGKKRLAPLAGSRSIGASRGIGKPGGGQAGFDFTERSRAFYATARELRSSDGLFVLQYYNVSRITMNRGVFTYLDHDPDAQ
jgi:hypothetical protein